MTPLTTLRARASAWAAALVAVAGATAAVASPPGALPFGVYDPGGTFSAETDVQIEHLFLPWQDVFLPSLFEADAYAAARGRSVLVTIEPWSWISEDSITAEELIAGIQSGAYDDTMGSICGVLGQFQSAVTVRWGQEMENTTGRFVWAGWEPETFVNAFRRMVDVCRAEAPELDFMWSPLGLEGFEVYYPGPAYVDVVGLSVFGLQAWESQILGAEQSFRDILEPRYNRAATFGHPVVVAELGFLGDEAYMDQWIGDVRQDIAGLEELVAVIYFNQQEVYPWPDGFGLPDWRLGMLALE